VDLTAHRCHRVARVLNDQIVAGVDACDCCVGTTCVNVGRSLEPQEFAFSSGFFGLVARLSMAWHTPMPSVRCREAFTRGILARCCND